MEKEATFVSLKESLAQSSEMASKRLEQVEELQIEMNNKLVLISQLEQTISARDQTIYENNYNIEMKAQEIQSLELQIGNYLNEMTQLKATCEEQIFKLFNRNSNGCCHWLWY